MDNSDQLRFMPQTWMGRKSGALACTSTTRAASPPAETVILDVEVKHDAKGFGLVGLQKPLQNLVTLEEWNLIKEKA